MISRFFAAVRRTLRLIFKIRVKAGPGRHPGKGRHDDPDDGSVAVGVTVPLKPRPPVLIGKDAKAIPTDGEDRTDLAA